jgi:hypothetical protein
MPRGLSLTVGVVAVLAALGAGWLVDDARRGGGAVTPAAPPVTAAAAISPSQTLLPAATVETPAARAVDAADLLAKQLGETVDASTAAAVRDRAERLRKDLLAQAEAAEVTVANQVAREIRRERAEREDRMRGGTMAFLEGLQRNWTPQFELVRSPEKFGALFARKTNGPIVDGATLSYATPPADGTTIRFPAGIHRLDVVAMGRWQPFPKDLVIEGAGMDATALVGNDMLRADGPVHSLTYRNLTMDTGNNDFQRIRGGPFTLRLDRCRIVGFDDGAGGSDMLSSDVGAVYATDCRFETGFGSSPGRCNLFDVRGALLVRMENCDLVGPYYSVFDSSKSASQVFARCRLTRMTSSVKRAVEGRPGTTEFADCKVEYLTKDDDPAARAKRALTEFNPAWTNPKR